MSELLGVLFAVMIGTLLMSKLAQHQTHNHEISKEIATAQQHKKINEAATAYIQQHAHQLQAITSAATPAII